MHIPKNWLSFLFLSFVLFPLVNACFADDWQKVVPQERLTTEVSLGSISPAQFQEIEKISIQEIFGRENVQNLLRNQFEMLGEYGETKQGLIVQGMENWERFGKHVGLSGEIFKQVYDLWYAEKTVNRELFLGTSLKNTNEFFDQNFSSTEEGTYESGETINWNKFAEEKGLPASAVAILIAMYGIWWRRKKFENDDFGGFKSVYETVAEKISQNWSLFYEESYWEVDRRRNQSLAELNSEFAEKKITRAEYEKRRIVIFEDSYKWNIRAWDFVVNKISIAQESPLLKEMAQKIISKVSIYTASKQSKQKTEFDKNLAEVVNNLSNEEIAAIIRDEFDPQKIPNLTPTELAFREELIERIDYVTPVSELFPMKFAPPSPPKAIMEKNVENLNSIFADHLKNQITLDRNEKMIAEYEGLLRTPAAAQYYWRNIWSTNLANARVQFQTAQKALAVSEKEIEPLVSLMKKDCEAYSAAIFPIYQSQLTKFRQDHQKRVTASIKKWKTFSQSLRSYERDWATQNIKNETEISQVQLDNEIESLQKSADFILQIKMMADKNRQIRERFNEAQKQKRSEYEQKRISNPGKENVVNYLRSLGEAGSQSYFSLEQKNILNAQKIQVEIEKLSNEMSSLSPYAEEIEELNKKVVCNQYTFEEYLDRDPNLKARYATSVGWVIKDEWIRNKAKIGNNGDYWQQKHAQYSQTLIATKSEYDPQKIALLNELAQKAHQEMLNSYAGWEKYFRKHPLSNKVETEIFNSRMNQLNRAEADRKKVLSEQIEVLEKEAKALLVNSFESARWLRQSSQERNKNGITNQILSSQIKSDLGISEKEVDPQDLITHFSEVRVTQENIRKEISSENIPTPADPFAFNFDLMIAPALRKMEYYSTPEGQARKTAQLENLADVAVVSQSRISTKNPIIYERNNDGTYTAFSRETGEQITEGYGITQTTVRTVSGSATASASSEDLVQQVSESLINNNSTKTGTISFTEPEVSQTAAMIATVLAEAEKIIAEKRESILELGPEAQLEALLKNMTIEEKNNFDLQQIKYALNNGAKVIFAARPTQIPKGIHTFIRIEPNNPNARVFTLGGYNSNALRPVTNELIGRINHLSDVNTNEKNALYWQEISNVTSPNNKSSITKILKSFFLYKNNREYYSFGEDEDYVPNKGNCNNFSTGLLISAEIEKEEIDKIKKDIYEFGFAFGFGNPLDEMVLENHKLIPAK